MDKFIRCLCDNELGQLVVEGVATAEELGSAWSTLFLEYCDLSEAHETKYRVRLQAVILHAKYVHKMCSSWIGIIEIYPMHGIIDGLQVFYPLTPFDPTKKEEYKADLARTKALLAADSFEIKIKEAEYENIKNSTNNSHEVDRKYFTTIFTRINSHAKYKAVGMQSTVEMYCAELKNFTETYNYKTE